VLLPGGTVTLVAGALIGAGRPAVAVAVPLAAAVIGGDHLAYHAGSGVIGWWRRRRPGRGRDRPPARQGRAARWLTAAMPSLAGIGRVAGIAGLAAGAALLAARRRLPVRAIARRPQARLAGLLLAAVLGAWVRGAMLQDTTAREETVHLNPRVAGLLASHVPPDAALRRGQLVPPGTASRAVDHGRDAVAFLDVRRRGRSTIRIAAATAASLAIAEVLDTTLPGWDRHTPVSLGAAAIAALAISTVFFAARWLDLIRAGIAAALGLAAAGLTLALAVAGQPFTALAAGASLGTAVAAMVEAAARLRRGRWLADPPAGTPVTA
jgi:hypothetical protein